MTKIIWTNHAIERNKERKITTSWVEKTITNSDMTNEMEDGKLKSTKDFDNQTVTVITTKTDSGENLILSAWIDPPNFGTNDYKKESYRKEIRKSSGLKRFWLVFKRQVGL